VIAAALGDLEAADRLCRGGRDGGTDRAPPFLAQAQLARARVRLALRRPAAGSATRRERRRDGPAAGHAPVVADAATLSDEASGLRGGAGR